MGWKGVRSGAGQFRRAANIFTTDVRIRLKSLFPNDLLDPIFIIAPPRSGSTLFFEALVNFAPLFAFTHREADHIWWMVIPYRKRAYLSDYVDLHDMDDRKRRWLRTGLYSEAVLRTAQRQRRFRSPEEHLGLSPVRYIDKTISNCFHLEIIADMFPDAKFVFLTRDPRHNIASMLEGWPELKRFGKRALTPYVQNTPGSTVSHWSYPAPPGWREMLTKDLPTICAWSWDQHIRFALDFMSMSAMPFIWVTYEDFVSTPQQTGERIASQLGIGWTDAARRHLEELPVSRTAVTSPDPTKWHRFRDEIERIRPLIKDSAGMLGYDV